MMVYGVLCSVMKNTYTHIFDQKISDYVEKKSLVAKLEKEIAKERDELLELGEYQSKYFKMHVSHSRREYLKSMKELKERFTPTELKGLLGVTTMNRIVVSRIKE